MSKSLFYLFVATIVSCMTVSLDARVRNLNLGTRSDLLEQKAEMEVQRPQMHSTLAAPGQKMEFEQWHSKFSTLGGRRSPLESVPLREKEMRPQKMLTFDQKEFNMYRGNREMASMQNWSHMKEIVLAEKFSRGEITSPQGRKLQQAVDELTLRDFNRYQAMRNKTDEGVPVQKAGRETQPELMKEVKTSVEVKD